VSNLTIINKNGQLLIDSREVAEMVGKRHSDLLESIKGYVQYLTNGNFRSLDFFTPNTYEDSKGEERPCYLLTRKGCDMVANKMTGEKGVLFTATYVTKFEEMEKTIKHQLDTSQLSPELQMFNKLFTALAEQELANKQIVAAVQETKKEVQSIREVVTLNPNSWRSEAQNLLNKIAIQRGGTSEAYREVRDESYKLLNERAGAKLEIRLTNRRRKVLEETGSKSKADKVSKLDVIADDKRLTEVYLAIVKDMAIRYKVA
jgi:Rha family phage regulatory protein